jgi:hypothetical protein
VVPAVSKCMFVHVPTIMMVLALCYPIIGHSRSEQPQQIQLVHELSPPLGVSLCPQSEKDQINGDQ